MPNVIIFILGVVVSLFALVAVILIGISEAEDLRKAGLLDESTDGAPADAPVNDRLRALQGNRR